MKRTPYLIIGNSAAALGAVRGIRSADCDGQITVVGKTTDHNYSLPLVPYWLKGKVSDEQMSPVASDYFERNRAEFVLGAEIVRIDTEERTAVTADGSSLLFDKALIATGGRPIVPETPDVTGVEGVFTFTAWEAARCVKQFIAQHEVRRAIVVGGGFIGVQVAEALTALGVQTTVVELADRILSTAFDNEASEMIRAALERNGIAVRCGTAVEAVHCESGRISAATLRNGQSEPCDLLLFAIGVIPDTSLADGSDIAVNRGICVDERFQTSVPGIYAAGDVAEGRDRLTERPRVIPLLGNARRQGFAAGCNMAGRERNSTGGVAMNSVRLCGLPCIAVGLASPEDEGHEIIVAKDSVSSTYRKLVLKDNRIVGAAMIGDTSRAGVITRLIWEGIDVAAVKHVILTDEFTMDLLPLEYWQGLGPA